MSKGILRTALNHKLALDLVFREAPIDWEESNLVDWERKGFTHDEAPPLTQTLQLRQGDTMWVGSSTA